MIPEGTRDVLPPESGRLRALESALTARFALYGYGEVRTPGLEFAETFAAAGEETLVAGYRLHDREGRELMVRTDHTVAVCRLAAARCRDWPLPLRFWYAAPCVRPWAPQRSQDGEFVQAGVELLGLGGVAAEAECIALLCDALSAAGLGRFKVTVGTVAFRTALVDALGLGEEDRADFLAALADRDYPLLESIADNAGVESEALTALWRTLELSGEDCLRQARRLARTPETAAVVDGLVALREAVAAYGWEDRLAFDLGLAMDLDYYSGTVFEAYAPGVGLPLASGGRYDGLPGRLGWDLPGVGFAVAVDRLLDALDEAGAAAAAPASSSVVFIGGLDEPGRAAELRRAGVAVAAVPATGGWAAAADEAAGGRSAALAGLSPAPAAARPLLLARRGGGYALLGDGGVVAEGSWCDVLRALGVA